MGFKRDIQVCCKYDKRRIEGDYDDRATRTLCNGSIKLYGQKTSVMLDSVGYLTGRKRHFGNSVDFQVNKGMGGGICLLPTLLIERRC